MKTKRPTTIAEYIESAPSQGQAHLRAIYEILKGVAPDAQEAIKWGNPFFVEPRFLFAFSAHKAHLSFAPTAEALEAFRDQLAQHKTTKHFLQIRYSEPVPEALIRKIAQYRLKTVSDSAAGGFW